MGWGVAKRASGAVPSMALGVLAAAALLPQPAAAARCPGSPSFRCSRVTVPLDRSGAVPGSISLFVERSEPEAGPATDAVFALPGEPGEAATDAVPDLGDALGGGSREVVFFDERGTGRSGALACPGVDVETGVRSTSAVSLCAARLGPRRAFYTSRDSADDIEAVRRSIGIDRIQLYAVSYGTYTALTYARRYPQHVESLILDSPIPPDGPDPFDRATYAAVPRMLRDNCAGTACRGITRDPVADLDGLVTRLARAPRLAVAFDSRGGPQFVRLTADRLHDLILSADRLDPGVVAELPSLLRSAATGDYAPLARKIRDTQVLPRDRTVPVPKVSAGAYLARVCEEARFPWSRTGPLIDRPGALAAAILAVPATAFFPWDRQTELNRGTSGGCLGWPDAGATSPAVEGPLPDVPALILASADDMRTPVENAEQVASLLPHATVVTVPREGHLVVDFDCRDRAMSQFEQGRTVTPCTAADSLGPRDPLPPVSLQRVRPARGMHGRAGRTVTAVEDSFDDAMQEVLVHLGGEGRDFGSPPASVRAGGLRGGFFRWDLNRRRAQFVFHRFAYVPGVVVSGAIRVRPSGSQSGRIVVGGRAAARGILRLDRHGRLEGNLRSGFPL
jgi:pimeloyl-ACP methyl ester carboxylesterase